MVAVAEKKQPPKADGREGRKSAPVQIDKELAKMAATIAAHDGITLSELLSPVLRQFLLTNYERVQREAAERIKRMRAES